MTKFFNGYFTKKISNKAHMYLIHIYNILYSTNYVC